MPQGVYPEANAKTAGWEISSTYEGRHVTLEESLLVHPSTGDGLVDKGQPVVFGTTGLQGVGVAFKSAAAATDLIAIDTEGIWVQSVYAYDDTTGSNVRVGDPLYINTTTAVISKINARATQILFGYALGNISAGATQTIAVKVHWGAMVGAEQVDGGQIVDGAVTEDKIGALAVTEGKIGAQAVTTAKIADAAVTQAQTKTKAVITIGDTSEVAAAAELVDSGIFACTPGEARTLTTDTAENIVAALPRAQVGTWFDVVVLSLAAHNVTFTAGAGVTVTGGAVANNASATFRGLITNIGAGTEAVTFYRM